MTSFPDEQHKPLVRTAATARRPARTERWQPDAKPLPTRDTPRQRGFGMPSLAVANIGRRRDRTRRRLLGAYRAWGKRAFDIVAATALLVLLAPVMAVLAGLVMLDGGRPIFAQRRIGHRGRPFRCLKFRTMVPDAEARLHAVLAADPVAADEWARDQKLAQDPRITRLGALLRRSSLDELPQLFNVLRGEMSLVGPRPVTEPELERYGLAARVYRSVRPGVTGPWQVSGRNATGYAERVALDVRYARDHGLFSDVAILLRTVGAVIALTGR